MRRRLDCLFSLLVVAAFVFWILNHSAQASGLVTSAYNLIQNGGTAVAREPTLNFVNGGCVDNSGSNRTDCTIAAGGGGIVTYSGAALTPSGTVYFPIGGGGASSATETNVDIEAPAAATVSNFYVQLSAVPGTGNSIAFTWRKNAAATALTCTIGAAATTCNDTTHTFSAAQGDLVDIQAVTTGTIVGSLTTVMATQFGTLTSPNVRKYSQTFTTVTSVILTDSLGTTVKTTHCYDAASPPNLIIPQNVAITDSNDVTVTFSSSQSGSCIVQG